MAAGPAALPLDEKAGHGRRVSIGNLSDDANEMKAAADPAVHTSRIKNP